VQIILVPCDRCRSRERWKTIMRKGNENDWVDGFGAW
jgi:hypothetical protein